MGATQTTNNRAKRYRIGSSTKSSDDSKHKRVDRFRTTMRSITMRALAARGHHNSVSSSNGSTMNHSSLTPPNTMTTINSQADSDPYLSDFDYRKLSTLTGLSEFKINELHREFLILSHNGRLTYERFKSMLESVPNQRTTLALDTLARQTFTLFDKDGSDYLDFAEFIAAYIAMERNELQLQDRPLSREPSVLPLSPKVSCVTRQATTYYSPQRTVVNTSPITSVRTPCLSSHRPSYYPQSSERYVFVAPPYTFR